MSTERKTFCNGNHILVGLGGTGGKILRAFKMRMFEEFPTAEERKKQAVALLYVDSTDEMMPKDGRARPDFRVMGQDASFTYSEFLNIKEVDVEHILDHIDNYPSLNGIVDNVSAVKSAIGLLGQAAGQKRRAGRLLFAANAIGYGYVEVLRNTYARCVKVSQDQENLSIHIFAGLCGGTGSGSIIDAILQSRKAFPDAKINVFVMIPEMNLPKSDMDQGRYYQNGYAAMNELNALQAGRWFPQDVTGKGEARLHSDRIKGVADGLTVYSNVNENGLGIDSFSELPKIVSDYIFARIFLINDEDNVNSDIIRAYNFESMGDFAYEYDETANMGADGRIPVARTKKVNSFGIKRVMYPELRILKHITYTVGESVLYQFKYNNWRENQGFVNEERNRDYRKEYLNADNLSHWMLDDSHLMLELKVLESDTEYPRFQEYWQMLLFNAEDAKRADCPLNELDDILSDYYTTHFREEGVESFYNGKRKVIPEISKEIRHKVESELFEKWKIGDISIVELQRISRLLLERITELRSELEQKANDEKKEYEAVDIERQENVREWSNKGIIATAFGKRKDRYTEHQEILTDYYTSKTKLIAWEFAKELAAKVYVEFGKMDADIAAFGQKINDAIEETERLVMAQRKVNKGLEDMKGAIIEVSEEESMQEFEVELKTDKNGMHRIANEIRSAILPPSDFINFGQITNEISIDDIKDAFDVTLSQIVKTFHDEKPASEEKVLGLNILTQLQQKLKTDDDIKAFATKLVMQSGAYLKLNKDQMQLHLRNNEGNISPTNTASINKKTILVSIPSPDENINLKKFADKLKDALENSFTQGTGRVDIKFNCESPRKDELSIVTVVNCFPIRAIDWMQPYKQRYEQFLNSGNPATDLSNAILLHSEGDGKQLPSLFAVDNAEEIARKNAEEEEAKKNPMPTQTVPPAGPGVPPVFPPVGGPGVPPPPAAEPEIQLHLHIGGQQYGPYDRATCKQLVANGQLTAQTLVWMNGMAAWAPAGQVPELQSLFLPAAPTMPPVPPMPPTM